MEQKKIVQYAYLFVCNEHYKTSVTYEKEFKKRSEWWKQKDSDRLETLQVLESKIEKYKEEKIELKNILKNM